MPGDSIAVRGDRLIINGQPGPTLGSTPDQFRRVIDVPALPAPAIVIVPKNCYFVCSDNASGGFDSRVLGWAERDKIISARVWYLRRKQFFERVE